MCECTPLGHTCSLSEVHEWARQGHAHREASVRPGAWGLQLAGAKTNVTKPRVGSYRDRDRALVVGKAESI